MNTFIVEAENYKTLQTENVDLSEYGITPDSVYSIKFEKGQDDTLMPQYQVRYPAHEEVTDELWNWLEEYGWGGAVGSHIKRSNSIMRTIRQCIRHIIKVNFIVIREKWHIYLIMGMKL